MKKIFKIIMSIVAVIALIMFVRLFIWAIQNQPLQRILTEQEACLRYENAQSRYLPAKCLKYFKD